jgi:hypothetical protein
MRSGAVFVILGSCEATQPSEVPEREHNVALPLSRLA